MANKAFSDLIDYTPEEIIGRHVSEFTAYEEGTYTSTTGEEVIIDEEYVTYTATKPAEMFETGYISNWETYLVRKDKVHVPTDIAMSVMKDKAGEHRGSLIVARDMTERRKTKKDLQETKDFLENIFKTTADGIIVTNKFGVRLDNIEYDG